MSTQVQSSHSGKAVTAAIFLALTGLLGIVLDLFGATGIAEGYVMMNKVADDHSIHYMEGTIHISIALCFALAMVFAYPLFSGRGSRVGIIGIVLATIGNLSHMVWGFMTLSAINLSESSSGAGIWDTVRESSLFISVNINLFVLTIGIFFLVPIGLFRSGRLPLWAMIACFVLGVIWMVPLPDIVIGILYAVPLFLVAWGLNQKVKQAASSAGSIQPSLNS